MALLSGVLIFIRKYWCAFSFIGLGLIFFFSLLSPQNTPSIGGSDKTHHLIAYAFLAIPVSVRQPRHWLLYLFGFFACSVFIEIIQPYFQRFFEPKDMLFNALGLSIGFICAKYLCKASHINRAS